MKMPHEPHTLSLYQALQYLGALQYFGFEVSDPIDFIRYMQEELDFDFGFLEHTLRCNINVGGYGWKAKWDGRCAYVSLYTEQYTPERRALLHDTNNMLRDLSKGWMA